MKAGSSTEREMSGDSRHLYELRLEAGQLATVAVEQRGIDVAVEVLGRDGVAVIALNDEDRLHGEERLRILADATAAYTIAVSSSFPRAPAGMYRIRLAETRAAVDRDRVLYESHELRTEARRLVRENRPRDAVPVAERALALAEGVLAPDDVDVGRVMMVLGLAYENSIDTSAALRHFTRAFDILEARLGPDHPQTTVAQNRLATTYLEIGDYATAERLILDALGRQEVTNGAEHPIVGSTLRSQASLLEARGDFTGAERALLRARAIVAKWFGTDNEQFAMVENNLGVIHIGQRDYQRAQPYLERSLAIREKILGPEHPALASVVQNLGIIAREKRDYDRAARYYERALAMRERSVGLEHPIVAGTLNNLANVYGARGDYAQSLAMHLRALAISEKHTTPWQQPILSLGNIARTYAALADFTKALEFQSRVEAALEADIALNLAIGSERQKIAYLRRIAERTERTISLHLQHQPRNPDAAGLAAHAVLRRKQRVLDAMIDTLGALRTRAAPDDEQLLDRLADVTTRFAQLVLAGPESTPVETHRARLRELDDERERLEAQISRHSDEFRAVSRQVTLESVQAAVPVGAALIEFAAYRPFNPKAESMTVAYGRPRYAAYIVQRGGVVGRDLGDAAAIDAAIEEYRAALQDPDRGDLPRVARALDATIMQPVRAVAGDATRFIVSPDGQLALIPFGALIDEEGRYLLETYPVSYVSAGRDLLRMQVPRASRSAAVVIADPLFGEPGITDLAAVSNAVRVARARQRRSVTSAEDLDSMYFAPLAGTRHEARSIQSVFPTIQVLTGKEATESALKKVEAPQILHIATHGFFVQESNRRAPDVAPDRAARRIENPLLRSGLALAGANLATAGSEDGILTALEAAHLNLWGTKLVTLSACDTGIGVVRNGEGVYGLRRSMFLAGAESLVMSLWPVSDYVTREMMTAYYKNLKRGLGRGDALREVQLSMLKRKGREHPFYWASFIQAGDWRPLDGGR